MLFRKTQALANPDSVYRDAVLGSCDKLRKTEIEGVALGFSVGFGEEMLHYAFARSRYGFAGKLF